MNNQSKVVIIDDINYELDELTGTAKVVKSEEKSTGDIIIPSTVTDNDIEFMVECIDRSAFEGCKGLISVIIPDSVTGIGSHAFYGCSGLTSITIGNSIRSIGRDAFGNCWGLQKVIVKDIAAWCGIEWEWGGFSSFHTRHLYSDENTEITDLIIPDGVTHIGHSAFLHCSGLTSVTIPNSVTSIGRSAFENCTGLTSIHVPISIISIEAYTFYGCSSLKSIYIPDSVTTIGDSAFEGCNSVISIRMGKNVTKKGKSAFSQSILKLLRGETWTDEYSVVFSTDKTVLYEAPKGLKEYIIPDGTKAIGQYAFSETSETLECVLFPDSVEIIENYAFSPAGGQWKKMKSIEIPNSVTFIGEDAFRNIEELKYKGNASGYPWGAKSVIDNKPHYVRYWDDPETRKRGLIYTGEMMNGKPHGKGGYYDRLSGTPHEEGTYYYGKLVSGDRWTSRGERYSPSGDTWNGYGTGVDSEGNVYTGKWIFGHTEEEFDELWHDIN